LSSRIRRTPDCNRKFDAGDGPDPTISLYATCKKLETGEADIIAIPCNTAHAFVERIQPYLNIPNRQHADVTVQYLAIAFLGFAKSGFWQRRGRRKRRYQKALEAQDCGRLSRAALQARVMNAIYAKRGKAGYNRGQCVDDIRAAIDGLAAGRRRRCHPGVH